MTLNFSSSKCWDHRCALLQLAWFLVTIIFFFIKTESHCSPAWPQTLKIYIAQDLLFRNITRGFVIYDFKRHSVAENFLRSRPARDPVFL